MKNTLSGWLLAIAIPLLLPSFSHGQENGRGLQPVFNAKECDELLQLNLAFLDTSKTNAFKDFLAGYRFIYRSPTLGLDNMWDLWMREDSVVVISIRGTTADPKSILADFYCAMLPSNGEVVLPVKDTVRYLLASDNRAAVQAGFLVGFAYMSNDIRPKLDSLYRLGYHQYLVTGHSQGGSLCYYVSSWLHHLKAQAVYPMLTVKTYASAPTKMCNMYFAYDYDNLTRSKWTYNIINAADPIPEVPFTTQQIETDINQPNPFMSLYKKLNDLPWLKRIFLKHAFNKMRRGAEKSSKAYQKYLGGYSEKILKQMLPGLELPKTLNTTYFFRPGVSIVLSTNDRYYQRFDHDNDGPYYHHGIVPYRFLLREYYDGLPPL